MPGFWAYWLWVIRGYLGDMDMMWGWGWGYGGVCGWGSGICVGVFCGGGGIIFY